MSLEQQDENSPFRRTVPNYSTRSVQIRLLMLVFAVMTVIALMMKAGDPNTWRWLEQDRSKKIDSRAAFEANEGDQETRITIAPKLSGEDLTGNDDALNS